jgi:hypothetical protein
MNFCYLLIPGCYGYGQDYDGLTKMSNSIKSLRLNCDKINKIYVYGIDDNSEKANQIQTYCKNNQISFQAINLKHHFISNRHHSNPCQLSILIEKLYLLRDHIPNENICYVDVDTEFCETFNNFNFDLNKPVLHEKEYPMFNSYRGIERIFNILNKPIDMSIYMYNSGIIFVPLEKRKQIAQESIDLVIEMNKYDDTSTRVCNRLDEQLAISFYIQKYYSEVDVLNTHVKHFWASA